MRKENADHYFLKGGGEMGELIRAKDWSQTSLGNPIDWPESLRTMVAVMLDNPFGMYIAWGSEYTQIYNDGYRPILGTNKHPQALGISTRETFSEIWDNIIGSMFDDVMKGKAIGFPDLMLPLNRNGFVEECYFDFSYSPIRKDDGEVGGVLVTVIETTEKKKAEKALNESNSRFINNIMQAPIAMCIFRGKNHVVEIANEKMLNLWGKQANQVMNKPIFEGLPEAKDQGLEELVDRVYATGEKFEANERPVNLPRNGKVETTYVNFVYDAIEEPDGTISGIIAVAIEVTEQVISRRKIEESEQRFQAAISAVQGILWTNNAEGEMEGEQLGWATLTGQTYEEYQGYNWANAVHPDDAQPTVDAWNEAVEERKTFIFEHRVKTKDGQWRDFSIRAIPLINTDGTLRQWVGVHTDITDSKQAAKALKANEEKLTIVIEASELGTWEIDVQTNIVKGSRRLHEIMGYLQKNELSLTDTLYRIHPDYVQLRAEAFKKAYETGIFYFTGQIIWEDNSIHWIESKGKVFYDEQKNPVTIIGTTADITEEKQQQQILLESEQKFRLLADSMPQHIWTSDPQGNLNYYNQSVFNYSGLTPEQINEDGWMQIVHPNDREENIKKWTDSVVTGKDFLLEHRFRRYDGEYRWQLSRAIPQKDKNGNIQMWVGTSTDIQEQKTREEKKDEFISIASHEMKTPLTTAKAYLQMLEFSMDENKEDVNLYIKKASLSVKRLDELIGELLDVSKIRLGKLNYTITAFNFNDMVESTVENIQLTTPTHTIIKTGHVTNKVIGDKDRLQQVVINLLTNAIKYSPGAEKVFITLEQENDMVKVSVKDTGIGIAKQSLDKIFDKYHRVEEHAVHFQGLGIGLFISYEIIQRHHGKLWAESEPKKGSTFYFTIPLSSNSHQ